MQKLIYINTLGEELHLGGEVPYILAHVEGTGAVERKIASIEAVGVSGEYITGARRLPRRVQATIGISTADRREMYRLRQTLCDVLSLDKVFVEDEWGNKRLGARLIYENDFGRWQTYGLIEDEVDFQKRVWHWQTDIKLRFKCPDSYWYAMGEEKVEIAFNDTAFRLPFRFPINFGARNFTALAVNQGSIQTSAIIEIHGQGEHPVLLNKRNGKYIKLSHAVPQGSILTINTDERELSARIVDSEGEESSAFGLLDPQHPISEWQLLPGENELVYEPGAEAALTKIVVRWRSKYEGV